MGEGRTDLVDFLGDLGGVALEVVEEVCHVVAPLLRVLHAALLSTARNAMSAPSPHIMSAQDGGRADPMVPVVELRDVRDAAQSEEKSKVEVGEEGGSQHPRWRLHAYRNNASHGTRFF
eukprot:927415-Rhodomonas_salina.2